MINFFFGPIMVFNVCLVSRVEPIDGYGMFLMSFNFFSNCLIDGLGEDCLGGEAALTQTLMKIFVNPGFFFSFVRVILC